MRDDEGHASLGPRRVLLVVGLHRSAETDATRPNFELLLRAMRRRNSHDQNALEASHGEACLSYAVQAPRDTSNH